MLCVFPRYIVISGSGQRSRYSHSLQVEGSGDRIPVGARFSAPVQKDYGTQPASSTIRAKSLFGGLDGLAWR